MPDGYSIFLGSHQVLSITTRQSQRGQRDLYINALGTNTHGHLYVPANLSGATAGYSLKDRGTHIGSSLVVSSGQPQEFLTVELRPDLPADVVSVRLISTLGEELSAAQVADTTRRESSSHERLQLPGPTTEPVEVGFRFVACDYEPKSTKERLLKWSDQAGWAVALQVRSSRTT